MVKQKTIEDPNKEIWLLRVPSSISLDAVNNLPIAKEQGDVGAIVARSKGAARDHGGPVGRAFGGDIVVREESALADDIRPLVKTRSGSLRCAGVPVSRQLSLAVEHDPATTEMDAAKYVPAIVAPAVESVWSKDPIGEELLGKDFAEKTGYIHPIWSRSAYNGKLQPRDVRARFFPNATREPRDGSAPPGVVSSAPTKKRKSDAAGSEKKKVRSSVFLSRRCESLLRFLRRRRRKSPRATRATRYPRLVPRRRRRCSASVDDSPGSRRWRLQDHERASAFRRERVAVASTLTVSHTEKEEEVWRVG